MMKEVGRQGSAVKVGKRVGAPRFDPIFGISPEPQPDHDPLPNKTQMAVLEHPYTTNPLANHCLTTRIPGRPRANPGRKSSTAEMFCEDGGNTRVLAGSVQA